MNTLLEDLAVKLKIEPIIIEKLCIVLREVAAENITAISITDMRTGMRFSEIMNAVFYENKIFAISTYGNGKLRACIVPPELLLLIARIGALSQEEIEAILSTEDAPVEDTQG